MSMPIRILLVEDEEHLLEAIKLNLELEGYKVVPAVNGHEAVRLAKQERFNLVVLDVMLPGLDGFAVCEAIRLTNSSVPVLFLSAKNTPDDKIMGLKRGADDYMTKPFSLEELVARLKSILRRTGVIDTNTDDEKIRFADLELDEATHEVRRAGDLIELSPTEFTLLRYLLINADRVVSKAQILDHVWQYDFRGDAGIVETYISYLRKKIDSYEPALIHTVRGVGYRLRMPAKK